MKKQYILGVDQGTTGTTTLILNDNWEIVSRGYIEHKQIYPKPGWVEHDPIEIWEKTKKSIQLALDAGGITIDQIKALGLDTITKEEMEGIPEAPKKQTAKEKKEAVAAAIAAKVEAPEETEVKK